MSDLEKYREWIEKEVATRVDHLIANSVIPKEKAKFWDAIIMAALDEGKRYGEQRAKN